MKLSAVEWLIVVAIVLILGSTVFFSTREPGPVVDDPTTNWKTSSPDQCLRREIFNECLAKIPKGPEKIHNSNDWDEAIDSCASHAYKSSLRQYKTIKPECRV